MSYNAHQGVMMHSYADIKAALGQVSGGRILDVATGMGSLLQELEQSLESYEEIVAIDSVDWRPRMQNDLYDQENISFRVMDAHALDLPDASFDTVAIGDSLHHMVSAPQVLDEMYRVLKPGGTFIVGEMYRDDQTEPQLVHVALHHWAAEIDMALGTTHHPTFARRELLDMIEGIGLQELAVYDFAMLDDDPKREALVEGIDKRIEHMLKRAEDLPNYDSFQVRGAKISQRLRKVGFAGATRLFAIGKKARV